MTAPLVSVVIPTYNQPDLLLQTLDSVFAQSMSDYEIVVINDGSTDDTLSRLQPLADRIRIVTQDNQGIGAARNRGIDEARGKYIALLDHDDLWLPHKLRAQTEFLRTRPECVAVSVPWASSLAPEQCAYDLSLCCDARGVVQRPFHILALGHVFLITSAIMFDRERCQGLRYATRRQCIEDVPFQIGLFTRGQMGIAGNKILMIYREHARNYSSQAAFFYNGLRMLREMHSRGAFDGLSDRDRADLHEYLGHIGRTTAVRQLLGGYRWRGATTYAREFWPQIRGGHWRFTLTYPMLVAAPRRLLYKRWKDARVR